MPDPRSIPTRIGLALGALVLGVFLVLGFQTPDEQTATLDAASAASSSTDGTTTGSVTSGATPAGRTATPTSSAGTETVTGSLVSTRYGPVQVQVTVSNGAIVDITAVALPAGGHSGQISQYAAPILTGEALAAQSAQIDLVSGATYTSTAYERSLQSALDQVGV